jgi:YVTN family beta-propeller protein
MTNKVVATIAVAPNPHCVMSVIDTATRSVTSVVSTGRSPHSVAVSPDGRQVDVADYDSDAVTVIDAFRRTVAATVPVGVNPRCVAYSPDGQSVYIVNEESDTLSIIDTRNQPSRRQRGNWVTAPQLASSRQMDAMCMLSTKARTRFP